jgi:mono/diheme cytochrome c family protein
LRVNKAWLESYLKNPVALRRAGYNPGDGSRMPNFHLAAEEAKAVTDELMAQRAPLPGLRIDFTARPLSAFDQDKALRLLEDKLSCLGCHRLGDKGGVLGPDLSLVSTRLQPSYAFSIIADPHQLAPHSIMPQMPMPIESGELIARFLLTSGWSNGPAQYLSAAGLPLLPVLGELAPPTRTPQVQYLRHCAGCHGVEGRADGFNSSFLLPSKPTRFADPLYLGQRPDDTLFDGIHSGGRILNRSPWMPPWGGTFSGQEIRGLVHHLRTLCQCEGPAWTRDGAGK